MADNSPLYFIVVDDELLLQHLDGIQRNQQTQDITLQGVQHTLGSKDSIRRYRALT